MSSAIELIHRVPIPTSHPGSIAFGGDGIWIADVESREIRLVDPRTGATMRRIESVVRRPQTITWDGTHLWEYDEVTCQLIKRSVDNGETFLYGKAEGVNTPYLGMTCRDRVLWIIAPDQPEFTVNNNIITVVQFPRRIQAESFEAPTYSCRGLCHDGRCLWTIDVENRELFALDPYNGIIFTSYELPGCIQPSSMAITEDRFHTMDLKTNMLLTFRLDRSVRFTTSGGRRSEIDIRYPIRNIGPGTVKRTRFYQFLPRNYMHQRMVGEAVLAPPPEAREVCQWDEGEGEVARFALNGLAPGEEREVSIRFTMDTVNLKFHLFPERTGSLDDIPSEIRRKYLFDEMARSGDPGLADVVRRAQILFQTGEREIKAQVEEIVAGERNAFWIARKIFNWVINKIKYSLPYTSITSRKILEQGKGSCGNHATIYIALCQTAGLPARGLMGFGVWKEDDRLGYLDHELAEVYLPGYGWVPADTSRFMSLPIYGTHPLTKFRSFGTLSERFFANGFPRDLRSPWARGRYSEERMAEIDGVANLQELFFMRWNSKQAETWLSYPDFGHSAGY